jgi:hypothetical protein
MSSAATALFPGRPEVATYVDCVARRRGFDKCNRTVPVFAGETKIQFMDLGYSNFQMVVNVTDTATAALDVCSGQGTATRLWLRKNQPVALTAIDGNTGRATITSDDFVDFTQPCTAGPNHLTGFLSPGQWFLLLDSPDAFLAATPGFDVYKIVLSGAGYLSRPAATTPPACHVGTFAGAPTISPSAPSVETGRQLNFTASGGTGAGYVFTLGQNRSGATITPSGAYTAGPTAGVTDLVRVTDSGGGPRPPGLRRIRDVPHVKVLA